MLMHVTANGGVWTRKRVCTESWLWKENPLPHQGIEPVSAAWRSDALTSWATSHPFLFFFHLVSAIFWMGKYSSAWNSAMSLCTQESPHVLHPLLPFKVAHILVCLTMALLAFSSTPGRSWSTSPLILTLFRHATLFRQSIMWCPWVLCLQLELQVPHHFRDTHQSSTVFMFHCVYIPPSLRSKVSLVHHV